MLLLLDYAERRCCRSARSTASRWRHCGLVIRLGVLLLHRRHSRLLGLAGHAKDEKVQQLHSSTAGCNLSAVGLSVGQPAKSVAWACAFFLGFARAPRSWQGHKRSSKPSLAPRGFVYLPTMGPSWAAFPIMGDNALSFATWMWSHHSTIYFV